MPNVLNSNGLTVMTSQELIAYYTTKWQEIYGPDIVLSSDTPDGQMMMIFVQSILDLQDLLVQINNGFDPDLAQGKVLDQRVAINGIQRQAGTYTTTNITIVISQALTLYGLDQTDEQVYTIADSGGNEWQLVNTVSVPGAQTIIAVFRSALPGAYVTVPNDITIPVTIVLGVTSVNNPTTYTTLGINEESDFDLKIRRQRSVSLASQGYRQGLIAALENISGIVDAYVYENNSSTTDADGTPPHTIWVIVSGTYDDAEVAQAIYRKRNAGAGMRGAISYTITQPDGTPFDVYWDVVVPQTLYIKFTQTSLAKLANPSSTQVVNIASIKEGLPTIFVPRVNEQVNVNDLATAIQSIDNNCLVTNAGFSTDPAGPFETVLQPTSKDRQFQYTSAQIIIIPIILAPTTAMMEPLEEKTFAPQGGYPPYSYALHQDESGADLTPAGDTLTVVYEAGGVTPATDIIRVTDSQGNIADATITVN